jgi:hypothetical protein
LCKISANKALHFPYCSGITSKGSAVIEFEDVIAYIFIKLHKKTPNKEEMCFLRFISETAEPFSIKFATWGTTLKPFGRISFRVYYNTNHILYEAEIEIIATLNTVRVAVGVWSSSERVYELQLGWYTHALEAPSRVKTGEATESQNPGWNLQ